MINQEHDNNGEKTPGYKDAHSEKSLEDSAPEDSCRNTEDKVSLDNQESIQDEMSSTDVNREQNNELDVLNEKPESEITADISLEYQEIQTQDSVSAGDTVYEIQSGLERLEKAVTSLIGQLKNEFESKIKYDRFKENQISNLHNELQEYKSDLLAKVTHPLIRGMIRIYDNISKNIESFRSGEISAGESEKFFNAMEGFKESIEILLNQNGVSLYAEPGDTFNPNRQTAVKIELTDIPEDVGKITRRVLPGFEQGKTIIQLERVVVFALDKADKTKTPAPSLFDIEEEKAENQPEAVDSLIDKEENNE